MILSLQAGAELCGVLERTEKSRKCQAAVARLRKHIPDPNKSKQAAALMALAGLGDAATLNREVMAAGGAKRLSTFYGYYVLQARAQAGDYQGCLNNIRDFWGGMLDLGATTFWEDFNLDWTVNAGRIDELVPAGKKDIHGDFGNYCYKGFRHSLCHGWASGPTAWLSEHVLGIQIVEPGCKTDQDRAPPGRSPVGRRHLPHAFRRPQSASRSAVRRHHPFHDRRPARRAHRRQVTNHETVAEVTYCKESLQTLLLLLLVFTGLLAGDNKVKPDSPGNRRLRRIARFSNRPALTGICFTGRHSDYHCGDTWYPSWAADGNLYSPWTDGHDRGRRLRAPAAKNACTGNAVMIGDDPLRLKSATRRRRSRPAHSPIKGAIPCGSLVYNGVWYYGTYCLGPAGSVKHDGMMWNWPVLGPMPGFRISTDCGKTWTPSPLSPAKPLFPEPRQVHGLGQDGLPALRRFRRNMQHSPDGKAYLVGMGAEENDPKPRYANLSWITGDQVYLARVTPSIENINDIRRYEFLPGTTPPAGRAGRAISPGSSRCWTGTTTWAARRSPTTRR